MPLTMSLSTSMCLSCLKRSLTSLESSSFVPRSAAAAFSTTTSLSAQVQKKKGPTVGVASRGGKSLRLTKNRRAVNTRPPASGERRALRKRVVLSNSNALEVSGLPDLNSENATHEKFLLQQGNMMGLSDFTVDALRALEAFKPTQRWNLFRRPATLVRRETAELVGDFDWISQGSREGRTVRKVLMGARGSGKSVLQLQALAIASVHKWVVIHIPEAKDLTFAQTSYEPIETAEGTMYVQPHYIAKLLEKISKANAGVLGSLKVQGQPNLGIDISSNTSLVTLADIGANDPDLAWPVWQALWSELLSPSDARRRPPILYSVDGFDHIMRHSAYLNPDVKPIHAHALALVKHFMGLLSGRTALPNGGMVLAAVSESNRAAAPTLHHCLQRNLAIQNGKEPPKWDPYAPIDKLVQDAMESVGVIKLEGLSKAEATGVMEYYAKSGILKSTVTNNLVSEIWTLAGSGIIGEIENGTLRARF